MKIINQIVFDGEISLIRSRVFLGGGLVQDLILIVVFLFQFTPKVIYLTSISVLGTGAIIVTMLDRYVY